MLPEISFSAASKHCRTNRVRTSSHFCSAFFMTISHGPGFSAFWHQLCVVLPATCPLADKSCDRLQQECHTMINQYFPRPPSVRSINSNCECKIVTVNYLPNTLLIIADDLAGLDYSYRFGNNFQVGLYLSATSNRLQLTLVCWLCCIFRFHLIVTLCHDFVWQTLKW